MRINKCSFRGVSILVGCIWILSGCVHGGGAVPEEGGPGGGSSGGSQSRDSKTEAGGSVIDPIASFLSSLEDVKAAGPVELKLKADSSRVEKVEYFHRSSSSVIEDDQIRRQKDETLKFTSQAETLKIDSGSGRFTQMITVIHKDGVSDLHDFAMPEPGEKLEVVADNRGRIWKAGNYPSTSIFFVPPISLPEGPVAVGETWTMQATWASRQDMVPFRIDMVSILKGIKACGKSRCADIELSGEVNPQVAPQVAVAFKSAWRGRLLFDLDAGTVLWSRIDSEEQFATETTSRKIDSCLEAVLVEPADLKLVSMEKPACAASQAAILN